jgi:hypothetical protein
MDAEAGAQKPQCGAHALEFLANTVHRMSGVTAPFQSCDGLIKLPDQNEANGAHRRIIRKSASFHDPRPYR